MGGLGLRGIPRGRVAGLHGNNSKDLHRRDAAHQATVQVPPLHGTHNKHARLGTRVKALAANTTGERT